LGLGLTKPIELSDLRGTNAVLDILPETTRLGLETGLGQAFSTAFAICAAIAGLGLALAWLTRDLPLRTSSAAEPASIGH
jgi:hypothetical protein